MLAGCGAHAARALVPTLDAEVVATFPHSPEAFTQGLELHDGRLYESTGLLRHSSVRVETLETGTLEQIHALAPELYAEGLTIFHDRVYQLTYQSGRCFVYDAETLSPIGEHAYEGEGWGLAHDERSLVLSDGTHVLRFLDPDTFEVLRRVAVLDAGVPVERLNELEWVEGELLANVWMTDRIARIDPESGRVIAWIDLHALREGLGLTEPEAVLNGIAYEAASRRLFVTGKLWPALYEIRVR